MYYPTNALPDTTYMTYIHCYIVWHLGVILMQLSHKRCTSQTDYIPYLLVHKAKFFCLNLELKYVRLRYICAFRAEPDSIKPVRSELDRAETNRSLRRQNHHVEMRSFAILCNAEW
jgi:hypothetical protein